MTRPRQPALYLGTVSTGSGVDIHSREGQVRLCRALLTAVPQSASPAPDSVREEQAGPDTAA
ncbi:hypothetical protein SAMN04488058_101339 [Deinococcus reticulitermitis]|uniref:Uncharacterized protein n=1 Tax=Deinococcus reticulitermitis TaxID=856736 RepID=A0A1H6SL08_9DEIO|nr:hypothetical protein [Deinococcus reticulitermitis]SEI68579.1 hypothetical protein SAMN04488058_101339 [Deinococcus reticulitermitis]